uniref:Uncharacterized protein n=1 Tax=Oryza meridionalis TaxID=40149 RepID=A0A0E0BVZ8_9ORYZ
MPSLRPILLTAAAAAVAVVSLWSAACVVADIDPSSGMPSPPATTSPFPFCPTTPAGISTQPFPWAEPSPTTTTTMFPQDPGFLASAACHARTAALAWIPVFSAPLYNMGLKH